MMKVEDLDVLRPEPRWVRINKTDIDVSFIPCGLTFEVDALANELRKLDMKKAAKGGVETKKAFDLSIKLCAVFCSHVNPEMDEEWFLKNSSVAQVEKLATAVQQALVAAYAGIEAPKNLTATRMEK